MTRPGRFLFIAAHQGPYLSIQPLEQELGETHVLYLVEGIPKEGRIKKSEPFLDPSCVLNHENGIEGFLKDAQIKAVVRSTSEGVTPRNIEQSVSRAAATLGLPLFVVEDFPGNYWPDSDSRLDGLFIEDDSLVSLHRARGVDPKVIFKTGNPRYAAWSGINSSAIRERTRQALGLRDDPTVLWAGQPDGGNSYHALERVLRNFACSTYTLLFRAHPRDEAYREDKYQNLLAGSSIKIVDVTNFRDTFSLYSAADLVMTQFSSAGVEASHMGIPAVFVLFDDLGKEYLRESKGYELLPWCQNRCSFLIKSANEVQSIMDEAIFNDHAREEVRRNFQRRFRFRADTARIIAEQIRSTLNEIPNKKQVPIDLTSGIPVQRTKIWYPKITEEG